MVWLVVALGVLAFLQAIFLYPALYRIRPPAGEPANPDVDLPGRDVRVLASGGSPLLVLKTPLDLPEADRQDFLALDEMLFPGGEKHRYYALVIRNDTREDRVVDLAKDALVLEDEAGGTYRPVNLAGVVEARAGDIPPYLLPRLRIRLPESGRLPIPPGSRRMILLAYPEGAAPGRLARATMGDEVLMPRDLRKDTLDGELEAPDARLRAKRP